MTDTERLDALEKLLWDKRIGNGVLLYPVTVSGKRMVQMYDIEDSLAGGRYLGEESGSLRSAIDEAVSRLECTEPFSRCLDCDDRGGCERYREHRGNARLQDGGDK